MPNREVTVTSAQDKAQVPATISTCQDINRQVSRVKTMARDANWDFFPDPHNYDPDGVIVSPSGRFRSGKLHLPALRKVLNEAEVARNTWRTVNRPATPDEIAVHVGLLLVCFPANSQSPRDRRMYENLLALDVADVRPSLYEITQACAHVRRHHTYPTLQIADLITAIEAARKKAGETQLYFDAIPYMHKHLDEIENPPPPPHDWLAERDRRYMEEAKQQNAAAKAWREELKQAAMDKRDKEMAAMRKQLKEDIAWLQKRRADRDR